MGKNFYHRISETTTPKTNNSIKNYCNAFKLNLIVDAAVDDDDGDTHSQN